MTRPYVRARDLTGQRFGQLIVLALSERRGLRRQRYWLCRCDCGKEKLCRQDGLLCGDYVSCGCKKIEQLRIHGATGSAEHKASSSMIERCYTPTHQYYSYYGGRGVTVCDRWKTDFNAFFVDVGSRPTPQHSLDRFPDNNGNYERGNVRWATKKEQARNRRNTKLSTDTVEQIRCDEGSMTQAALGRMHGVSQSMISRLLSGECWT